MRKDVDELTGVWLLQEFLWDALSETLGTSGTTLVGANEPSAFGGTQNHAFIESEVTSEFDQRKAGPRAGTEFLEAAVTVRTTGRDARSALSKSRSVVGPFLGRLTETSQVPNWPSSHSLSWDLSTNTTQDEGHGFTTEATIVLELANELGNC